MFLVGFDRKKKNAKQKISTFFFLSCICLNCCFLWIGKVQTMGGLYSVFFFFCVCVCVCFFSGTKQKFLSLSLSAKLKTFALLPFYCLLHLGF
jgi:hypothetical protein